MNALQRFGWLWQCSCLMDRHNKGIRGERELRGERRGKGGRSLATAAASSFFILHLAAPAAGQWQVELRAGAAASSTLLEDLVATPRVAQELGDRFQGSVRAQPAPGPAIAVVASTALAPRYSAELAAGYTFSTLRATDGAGTRDLQDLGIGHATLGIRMAVSGRFFAAAGFGAIRYFAEEEGLFAGGSDLSPLLEGGAGARVWRDLTVRATGQIHRFGTPSIRTLGGQEGSVFRWLVQAGWTVGRVGG